MIEAPAGSGPRPGTVRCGVVARSDGIEIRLMTAEDAPGIARVLVDTWRSTFDGLLPEAFLDGLSYQQQEARQIRAMAAPGRITFVAVRTRDGEVVGFASGGPIREPCLQFTSELYAIYVLSGLQGRGIGRDLFRAFVGALDAEAKPDLLVWVLAINPFSGFYSRMEGRPVAEQVMTIGVGVTENAIAYAWDALPLA